MTLLDEEALMPPEPVSPAAPSVPEDTEDAEEPETEEPEDTTDVSAYATALIGACLDRYGSRVRACRRAVSKDHNPDEVEALVAEERARLSPKVAAEVVAALRLSGKPDVPNGTLTTACLAVEAGADAGAAAAQFWSTI